MKLRIATRKSKLALTQTRWVAERIREHTPGVDIEEVHVVTEGDRVLDKPLAAIGGKGLFVTEVEATLLDGRADLAVHSMKDVPNELSAGLEITCIPEREDPRDALITPGGIEIDALPAGARVGTSSLRRSCQLKGHRPDLDFATLRGNVDTRLRKLTEGRYGAIVLAMAGLRRLSLLDDRHWIIPVDICIPAVGQGALGIEARIGDEATARLIAPLGHAATRVAVEAERAFLHELQGSCKVPVAGHATTSDGGNRLRFDGMVGSVDGSRILSGSSERYIQERSEGERLSAARQLGREVAEGLLAKGAADLIREGIATVERALAQGNGSGPKSGRWS